MDASNMEGQAANTSHRYEKSDLCSLAHNTARIDEITPIDCEYII